MARDPLGAYGGLARRYGDSVRLPYGRNRAVYLLSRPEHAERVLVANQDNYVKAFTYRPLRAFLGDGLLTSEGETWRRHRRLVQPVFAHRHVTGFGPQVAAVAERHSGRWPDGVLLDVAAEMRRLTLDVVGRALFGSELADDAGRTGDALARLQRGAMAATVWGFLPEPAMREVFRRAPGLGGASTALEGMVERVIGERRAAPDAERPADLLELLMASGLSDGELRDEVLTLLLAGHETTAASLAWTFVLLSRYPAARERLAAEVDEAGLDVDRLPWTRAVLSEAMRLYPPAWTIERDALADDDVAGVHVPAGSTVGVPPYLLHRHPEFWPNPEGFDPERFIGESGRPRHAYLPFGGGRRICVGAGFAMLEGVLVLAAISRTHRLDLAPGVAVPARAEITLRPDGPVPMRVSRRSGAEASG